MAELVTTLAASAIANMDALRQKIWDKLRGKSKRVDAALTQVEQGDRTALDTVAKNLDVAMGNCDRTLYIPSSVMAKEANTINVRVLAAIHKSGRGLYAAPIQE